MLTVSPEFDPDDAFGWINLRGRASVVVAVSGGSDSVALLLAFHRWSSRVWPDLRVCCVTVDHGLRPQSGDEARQVGELCGTLGVTHKVLRWAGDKPVTGLSAAAREARYALLAQAAREADTDIVLTGHTADDQAETVLMRASRATGRGLSGMARATLFDGVTWILRPFLGQSREALRSFLRAENVQWVDDPTNFDAGYERVRARRRIASTGERDEMIAEAHRWAALRSGHAEKAAELLRSSALEITPGLVWLDGTLREPDTAGVEAWRILLACVGGREHLVSHKDVTDLIRRLERRRSCLAGTMVTCRRGGIYLHREMRSGTLLTSRGGVFDGRYRLDLKAEDDGWSLAQRDVSSEFPEPVEADLPRSLAKAAWAAEPVCVRPGASRISGRSEPEILRHLAPFDHILPEFDLTVANAAAALFGRQCYPPAPAAG